MQEKHVLLVCPAPHQGISYTSTAVTDHEQEGDKTLGQSVLFTVEGVDIWTLEPIGSWYCQMIPVRNDCMGTHL